MIFFRYEKEDKGGPYFSFDGENRITKEKSTDDTLDGCLTIQALKKWFNGKEQVLNNCSIKKYDGELLHINKITGNAVFKKSTAQKLQNKNEF